ncbi:hypothetical protein OMR58_22410 [Erwinia sp. INIA-01]|uniref:conjugation system SOS inhibitor PsiB family protein n=1 Tax=Erwinia sp. INIA01 TaxID=2991500 RepID=UPI00222584D4|nr:conjugation system SOS inhibitor PsiB family protein [Erwinia sp. INIA01]MCW1877205.1 hypothetical protein [Erwinia sp. INIA01]
MSAKNSKPKRNFVKPSKEQKPAGQRCDMTENEPFTLALLQAFSPAEYEEYRQRGDEYRLRMSNAVLSQLSLSHRWITDCETRNEWGGVFPVHLRLTHDLCKNLTIDIFSPGNRSPFWHGLIWMDTDRTGLFFWNADTFRPEDISARLQKAEDLVIQGVRRPWNIASVLCQGEQE